MKLDNNLPRLFKLYLHAHIDNLNAGVKFNGTPVSSEIFDSFFSCDLLDVAQQLEFEALCAVWRLLPNDRRAHVLSETLTSVSLSFSFLFFFLSIFVSYPMSGRHTC